MIRNRKSTWRTIAAILTVALVFTLMPASASAVGVEPSGGPSASESAQGKYADRLKEYAAQLGTGGSSNADLSGLEAASVSDTRSAAACRMLDSKSFKNAMRNKIARLSGQSDSTSAAQVVGNDVRGFAGQGTPPVDAIITKLPYTDTRTIDKGTHKIKLNYGEDIELRAYVYQVALKKGAYYAIDLTSEGSGDFFATSTFMDGTGEINGDIMFVDSIADKEYFMAKKSGTYYMLIINFMELLYEKSNDSEGKYTVTLDNAYYLSGKVKDSKGKPVKSACVEILRSNTKYVNDIYTRSWTDSKGIYRIFGMAPGKYKIRADKRSNYTAKPKYGYVYYRNKHSLKTAKSIKMTSGKNKTGIDMKLQAYKPPKADKNVKKLPFKVSSKLYSKPREMANVDGYVIPARVYSVKLNKGSTYELVLNGKKLQDPIIEITDSAGYYAAGFQAEKRDKNIVSGSYTPHKTDIYRIAIYDYRDGYGYAGALSSAKGKFTLSVSAAYTPGSISGKVTRAGGFPYEGDYEDGDIVCVTVYKKHGKQWISYMWNYIDFEGKYRIRGLAPGEYKVKFYETDYEDGVGAVKYFKYGKKAGVKKMSKASKVKVSAGAVMRNINMGF